VKKKEFKLIFYFLTVLGIFSFLIPALALANQKPLSIWGQELNYEVVSLSNKHRSYDGLAIRLNRSGKKINRVILNTAYFQQEATEIWEDFQYNPKPSVIVSPNLMTFLVNLMETNRNFSQKQSLISQLGELKEQLQYAAWQKVYAKAKNKKEFIRLFIQTRKKTIEYHELSHLLDAVLWEKQQLTSHEMRDEKQFAHDTEVRAFLTELVYGPNPQDSLWQIVTGVLQEIKQGRSIDYSVEKLKDILVMAQAINWIPRGELLCFLCFLSKESATDIATKLYHRYTLATHQWKRGLL